MRTIIISLIAMITLQAQGQDLLAWRHYSLDSEERTMTLRQRSFSYPLSYEIEDITVSKTSGDTLRRECCLIMQERDHWVLNRTVAYKKGKQLFEMDMKTAIPRSMIDFREPERVLDLFEKPSPTRDF